MTNELIVVSELNALELFTGDGIDAVLQKIKEKVDEHVPDVSTPAGRKEIASLARRVSSSKVILDDLGKSLVADWKNKAKKVDAERKKARDELDRLRDFARQPLTDYEAVEVANLEAERLAIEKDKDEVEAYAEQGLRERERLVREKLAELAKQEAEMDAKAEAYLLESERRDRERRIAEEAADKARRETEEKVRREREAELAAEAEAKRKREALAKHKSHRAKIDRNVITSVMSCFYDDSEFSLSQATRLVDCIGNGMVQHVTINY